MRRALVRLVSGPASQALYTPVADIPGLVAAIDPVKRAWQQGSNAMIPVEDRRRLLQGIVDMLKDERDAIHEAEFLDLRRPKVFSDRVLAGTVASTELALSKLDDWMEPRKCENPPNMTDTEVVSSYVRYEPKGLALIIGTWNFPIPLVIKPLASAIAAGCPCVVKLSEVSPHTSELLLKSFQKYLDPKFVRVVYGGVEQASSVLKEKYGVIFYTGNTHVGKIVYRAAAENLTPCILELGGKNPVFVTRTANLTDTAQKLVDRKFQNVGQFCVSPDHVYLEKGADVAAFKTALASAVRNKYGDDPQRSAEYSRVINEHHFSRLEEILDDANHEGEIVVGGAAGKDKADLYIPPTIVFNPKPTSLVLQEEVFGPILPVLDSLSLDEALAHTHETGDSLASYIFSTDEEEVQYILANTRSGGAAINDCINQMTNETLPFGGRGDSGFGNYHGEWGFKAFSHERAVLHTNPKSAA